MLKEKKTFDFELLTLKDGSEFLVEEIRLHEATRPDHRDMAEVIGYVPGNKKKFKKVIAYIFGVRDYIPCDPEEGHHFVDDCEEEVIVPPRTDWDVLMKRWEDYQIVDLS